MARQTSAVELNNFVAGLITEASPLNFPENASLAEKNFILQRDGSRRRRLGMDFEDGFVEVVTGVSAPISTPVVMQTFRWRNAGGDPRRNLIVVQVGNELRVFDSSNFPISSLEIYQTVVSNSSVDTKFSFTVVDGILVVATGRQDLLSLTYSGGAIVESSFRLLVRDFFGVEDVVDGVNLRQGSNIITRPTTETDAHIYNLRNQTWASPRKKVGPEYLADPLDVFAREGNPSSPIKSFPSNSDVVTYSLYPDAEDGGDRLTDRFNWRDVKQNPIGSTPAPKGFFIIDALSRGTSRLSEVTKLQDRYPELLFKVSDLPKDTTPGGASVVAEYAGRVFYSGFSGEVVGGDLHSPKMSSYILFSRLIEDPSDIGSCYQVGDPTSKEEPDLLDTDGGFIRLDGAYGIVSMVNVGSALIIVASNGVWTVQGGSDYGFKATNYVVNKVTSYGCSSPKSVVQVDTSVMYWAEDGIYVVAQNQFGDYVADNLTQKTIQTFYEDIDPLDRTEASGSYDAYERKVTWTYSNRLASSPGARQLVFDTTLGAFYPFHIGESKYPMVVSGTSIPPYRLSEILDDVEVGGVQVTASGEVVTVSETVEQASFNETVYLAVISTSPTISFSFALLSDNGYVDWRSVDGVGVDAKAELLTGWQGAGDFQRQKQVPYVTFHFVKTEDGFLVDGVGDLYPTNPSSCLVSAQWEWTNSPSAGRWGRKFQAYRFTRHYLPQSPADTFNNGHYTVVTKNKLRGKGRVLSLLIETEPGKDCHLLGWSMIMSANGNV